MRLSVQAATKVWGSGRRAVTALHATSFHVTSGEVVGVIGPNGAGKSTLLALIAGEARLTTGAILIDEHAAGSLSARRTVGFAGDPPILPGELSASEWLSYVASHRSANPPDRLRSMRWALELADLDAFADRRIRTYSKGMAQRVALAAAAVAGRSLLVLDEMLSGVDPLVQRALRARIRHLSSEGRAVIVASHDLHALEQVATRVLVLVRGRVVADVATAALLDQRVAEITLRRDVAWAVDRLVVRFRNAEPVDGGVRIPLDRGLTIEAVLAACHEERVPVIQSRVRYETLEHILLRAAGRGSSTSVRDVAHGNGAR